MIGLWAAAAWAGAQVVAIGDLHGDLRGALTALHLAGAIDREAHWAGTDKVLVQTGDIFDRGDDGRGIAELLMRLQREAAAAGGAVHVLMGNHEEMNLLGDWRYVTPGDLAVFGGEARRREALRRDAALGAWLAQLPAAHREGDTVFVHGGLTAAWASRGVTGIVEAVRADLAKGAGSSLGPEGPLWYRGHWRAPEATACQEVAASLRALSAARLVVGHTVRDGGIEARCHGTLFGIDTGISSHYGGHVEVWRWDGARANAVGVGGVRVLSAP